MIKNTLVLSLCLTSLIACSDKETTPDISSTASVLSEQDVPSALVADPTDAEELDISTNSYDEAIEAIAENIDAQQQRASSKEIKNNSLDDTVIAAPAAKAVTASKDKSYIVEAGDTLTKIASAHTTTVTQIVDQNNLGDPNSITVGQLLIIK